MTKTPPGVPATSNDVAAVAGVSRSTVSYILNGKTNRFPKETRDKVLAAADNLGYRPSHAGRALATGRSDVIVLLLPSATFGALLQEGIDSLGAVSARLGLTLLVRFAGADTDETVRAVMNLKPAAVVDLGVLDNATREHIRAGGATVVPRPEAGSPSRIDMLIGRLQVEKSLEDGSRHLIYASLHDRRPDPVGPIRYSGALKAAEERGLPLAHISVPLELDGAVAALRAATRSSGPWAVCCFNDDVAMAVLAAARVLSIAVPESLTVIGVDKSAMGQLNTPRLTTVAVDFGGFMEMIVRELDPDRVDAVYSDPENGIRLVAGETM